MVAYFDPNFHSLEEYIVTPPTVTVDNDTYEDRTVVKVHGVNRHGRVVAIVQALTDLDLVISKANLSVDADWIMDAFQVRDELGNKLTDPAQISYIQESLIYAERRGGDNCHPPDEVKTCLNNLVGAGNFATDHAMVEMIVSADQPGLLSEVSATLLTLYFDVSSTVVWTHNGRTGFIFTIIDGRRPDPARLVELEAQLNRVVETHCVKWLLRISEPSPDRARPERRLHQIMREDDNEWEGMGRKSNDVVVTAVEMDVSVNKMEKKKKRRRQQNYMVEVNVKSRDRPKLVFDVVCTLEDLNYDVVHASVGMEEANCVQEYYVKKRDGRSRVTEMETERLVECVVAAVERRAGHWGMMMVVEVQVVEYRSSLLWEITKVFRENGMLVVGAKWAKRGEFAAAGVFYLTGGSSTGDVVRGLMRDLRGQIGGCIFQMKDGGMDSA